MRTDLVFRNEFDKIEIILTVFVLDKLNYTINGNFLTKSTKCMSIKETNLDFTD